MQTFLPYADFTLSAKVLDRQRLGKQRVEAWQILQALQGKTKGWRNHPVTKMWKGYESALCDYGVAICLEWISRGYKDTMLNRFLYNESYREYRSYSHQQKAPKPPWFGGKIHVRHRALLKKKNPSYYKFLEE